MAEHNLHLQLLYFENFENFRKSAAWSEYEDKEGDHENEEFKRFGGSLYADKKEHNQTLQKLSKLGKV